MKPNILVSMFAVSLHCHENLRFDVIDTHVNNKHFYDIKQKDMSAPKDLLESLSRSRIVRHTNIE